MRIRQDVLTDSESFPILSKSKITTLSDMGFDLRDKTGYRAIITDGENIHFVNIVYSKDTGRMESAVVSSMMKGERRNVRPLNFIFK